MKKFKTAFIGIVLIAAGVLFALKALDIIQFDIFFDGWWTLFIIIPCALGIITEKDKTGCLIGTAIGVFLLLWRRKILSFDLLWKLLIPVIIVIIGAKMVISSLFGNKANEVFEKMQNDGKTPDNGFAVFSGQDMNYSGRVFEGAELNAIFGGVKCDLRDAVIEKDCAIKFSAVFGGITVFVPDNVNVRIQSTSLFGGVDDKSKNKNSNAVTVYLKGLCLFGGVDVK